MGGTPAPPPPPNYMAQANAQNQVAKTEAQIAQERREWEMQQEQAKRQQQIESRNAAVNQFNNQGQSFLQNQLNNLGFQDNYGLADRFMNALNTARMGVPETASNVGDYFNFDQKWQNAMTAAEKQQQQLHHNQLVNQTPIGWQDQFIQRNAADDVLNAILGNQYDDAYGTVRSALDRGQMGQGAYDHAVRQLENQRLAGQSQLRDIGQGVLGGYRDQLGSLYDQYSDRAQNYQLGQDFNPQQFNTTARDRADYMLGGLQGDVYRAVGDTTVFRPDSVMARAQSASGATNNPLRNAFGAQAANNNEQPDNRTTGTAGVF